MMKNATFYFCTLLITISLFGCSDKGAAGIFAKRTPSEKYADKLVETGLHYSNLGRLWLNANKGSITDARSIKLPFKESGYFGAEKPMANAYNFRALRGEKITISLAQKPISNFKIYGDVFTLKSGSPDIQTDKLIGTLDSTTNTIVFEAEQAAGYILRLQPELLASGEYTLTITTSASLSFPVQGKTKPQSFWGDGRDNDSRKHEGVDIFASRGTPALAASKGTVTRVGTNNLGGNVVFMRPENRDYTLYYAHLDKQLVVDGQQVNPGDTIGLVGNTGNAITTTPHLHFGIYTFSGAIDPFPFINTENAKPQSVKTDLGLLGDTLRTSQSVRLFKDAAQTEPLITLPKNTLVYVYAASADVVKIGLPDHNSGFITAKSISKLTKLAAVKVKKATPVLESPDNSAPKKTTLAEGETLTILADFNNFNYVTANGTNGWIIK